MEGEKKSVLIALSGMSPAVLTEAVWGLAMSQPAVVPNEIVVLTTAKGRTLIQEQLLKSGIWNELKVALSNRGVDVDGKLVFNEEMSVFTHKGKAVEDLSTREQNLEAANTMMRVIRLYAEDGDWVIHALMAGGRKTMSALFFSSMCLLGRRFDHVYHVLVSDGYEKPQLQPPFFFPQQGVVHKMREIVTHGKTSAMTDVALKSEECEINLFDVPFVPMGEWAEQKCRAVSKGLNYENIITAVNEGIRGDVYPKIEIDLATSGRVLVDGKQVKLSCHELILLVYIVQGNPIAGALPLMRELKDCLCTGDDVDEMLFDKGRFGWLMKYQGDESTNRGCGRFGRYDVVDHDKRKLLIASDLDHVSSDLRKKMPKTSSVARLLNRDSFPSDYNCQDVVWSGYEDLPKEVIERLFLPETRKRLKI